MSEGHGDAHGAADTCRAALERIHIDDGTSWRGLTLFPLLSDAPSDPACDILESAHTAGAVEITEVSAAGHVGRVRARNRSGRPVLLIDGEELLGGKQNRIINITIVVLAGAQVDVPVSCVEKRRWHHKSPAFHASGRAMFAKARAKKMRDVTMSLRERGIADADQIAVWDDVDSHLRDNAVTSETAAMSAAWDAHGATIDEYVDAFPPHDRQVGAVFSVGGGVAGLELFDSPATWLVSAPRVIRSYALDLTGAPSGRAATRADAETFRAAVHDARPTAHPAVGAGLQLRFDNGVVTGGALVWQDRLIHLSAFSLDRP